jgi:hypothetical protein
MNVCYGGFYGFVYVCMFVTVVMGSCMYVCYGGYGFVYVWLLRWLWVYLYVCYGGYVCYCDSYGFVIMFVIVVIMCCDSGDYVL